MIAQGLAGRARGCVMKDKWMRDVQECAFDLVTALPDALCEAEYDDAIVGTGPASIVALGFMREGFAAAAVIAKPSARH